MAANDEALEGRSNIVSRQSIVTECIRYRLRRFWLGSVWSGGYQRKMKGDSKHAPCISGSYPIFYLILTETPPFNILEWIPASPVVETWNKVFGSRSSIRSKSLWLNSAPYIYAVMK